MGKRAADSSHETDHGVAEQPASNRLDIRREADFGQGIITIHERETRLIDTRYDNAKEKIEVISGFAESDVKSKIADRTTTFRTMLEALGPELKACDKLISDEADDLVKKLIENHTEQKRQELEDLCKRALQKLEEAHPDHADAAQKQAHAERIIQAHASAETTISTLYSYARDRTSLRFTEANREITGRRASHKNLIEQLSHWITAHLSEIENRKAISLSKAYDCYIDSSVEMKQLVDAAVETKPRSRSKEKRLASFEERLVSFADLASEISTRHDDETGKLIVKHGDATYATVSRIDTICQETYDSIRMDLQEGRTDPHKQYVSDVSTTIFTLNWGAEDAIETFRNGANEIIASFGRANEHDNVTSLLQNLQNLISGHVTQSNRELPPRSSRPSHDLNDRQRKRLMNLVGIEDLQPARVPKIPRLRRPMPRN